jgi:hypothetical protein
LSPLWYACDSSTYYRVQGYKYGEAKYKIYIKASINIFYLLLSRSFFTLWHKTVMEQKLTMDRARWLLQAPHLARALAYKTLKEDAVILEPPEIDTIFRYNVRIDDLSENRLDAAANSLTAFGPRGLESKQSIPCKCQNASHACHECYAFFAR